MLAFLPRGASIGLFFDRDSLQQWGPRPQDQATVYDRLLPGAGNLRTKHKGTNVTPLEVGILVLVLFCGLFLWQQSGFKCPLYIHVIGGCATAIGFLIASNIEPHTPINDWWLLGKWWAVLIMPAFVYGSFAVYGVSIYSQDD